MVSGERNIEGPKLFKSLPFLQLFYFISSP